MSESIKENRNVQVAPLEECPRKDTMASMSDEDIYALNPVFRLRNEKDYVLLHGAQGSGLIVFIEEQV